MTPIETARHLLASDPGPHDFTTLLLKHLERGLVYSSPTAFGMARPVDIHAGYELVTDPFATFEHPNAWWVYLASGDVAELLSKLPFHLQFIGWERKQVARYYRTNEALASLHRRIQRGMLGFPVSMDGRNP